MKGRYELLPNVGDGWAVAAFCDLTSIPSANLAPRILLGIRKFDAGQEVGCLRGIEVRVDRNEQSIRIALGKFNVAGRDLDHRVRSVTIQARLGRRTQIALTNFDLCHARLISDYARQGSGGLPAPLLLGVPPRSPDSSF